MSDLPVLWAIAGFIIVLTPIVLIHEFGHFAAAKLSGIRVEEFGLFLPPRAFTIAKRNGTVYSVNWIPVGGFVRPAGEDDPSVPGGFASASKRARLFVLVSGAGANFIAAFFIFWLAFFIGPPEYDETKIEINGVGAGSPAEVAGLQEGDIILSAGGIEVGNEITLLQDQVAAAAGQTIVLTIDRDGQLVEVPVVPELNEEAQRAMIGVALGQPLTGGRLSMGPVESAQEAGGLMMENMVLYASLPSMLLSGEISPEEARPVGPVGISQIAGNAAAASVDTQNLFPILSMAAFISIALGLTNLLPIPALDGGRIVFVLIEAVRGRRVEPEREGMVHAIGMLVLLGLMVLMIYQDIVNPILPLQ